MRNSKKKSAIVAVISLAGALALGACGGDSSSDTTMAADDSVPVISITGQWARDSAMTATMGAAYMTITADADDELTGAAVDPSVAMDAQIHEMVPASETSDGMSMSDSTMASDNMVMQEVDSIALAADMALELKPGGYHVMLMDLAKPLEIGSEITITLTFAKAGDVDVTVPVLEEAP